MHRIDGATAAPTLPAPGGVVGTPGYFSDGDPLTLKLPTTVTAAWANSLQEEVAHVIEASGAALNKASNTQLLSALQTLFSGSNTGNLSGKGHFDLPFLGGALRINWGKKDIAASTADTDTVDAPFSFLFGVWHGGGTTDPTQGYKTAAWPSSGAAGLTMVNLLNGTGATLTVHWIALGLA